jgi:ATP-dependent DNA helicase RecQ
MLNNYKMDTDAAKRAVYVGLTRAKSKLYIHYNDNSLNCVTLPEIECICDEQYYTDTHEIMLQLSYKDVVLGFFKDKKDFICSLKSGSQMNLMLHGEHIKNLAR